MATTLHDCVARYSGIRLDAKRHSEDGHTLHGQPLRRTTCTVSGFAFRAPCPEAYRLSTCVLRSYGLGEMA